MEMNIVQLNLSTTATLGTEESGRCRMVLNRSQWIFCSPGRKKSYHCREVPLTEV